MSPGVNGGGGGGSSGGSGSSGAGSGPRNTGTLPKSNRRNDRNRERSAVNQQLANRSAYHGHSQNINNLCQLDWQVASEYEREPRLPRETKNSNTRSASSQLPSSFFATYQDLPDFASHNSTRQCNYSTEDCTPWLKMVPVTDPRTQSPSRLQGTKPSNVNKMPDRNQVESRLSQIRDYIRVTATMIDSLNLSPDPRALAQSEKLSRMVDDLRDSETKLAKLLEQYHNHGISDENGENGREDIDECGDISREMQLRRNMEEYQNKLAQLQEQQVSLADMQLCVRERLNKARQAQQMLLQQDNQNASDSATWDDNRASLPSPANVEQLESETVALRGKLAQLQTKKKRMDHLVAELQAIEASDRGSCSSEGSRNTMKDKAAELETMKAQLAHIKALMEDSTKVRDIDSSSEPEQDTDAHDENVTVGITEDMTNSPFDRSNDANYAKLRCYESNISDVRALTSELKEQSALLQSTRAELQRLKQQPLSTTAHSASSNCSISRPPPALIPLSANEKKQSCNASTESQSKQAKRSPLEDLIRKELTQSSNVNRDVQALDQNSQRSSGSQASHTSIPANIWPTAAVAGGSNEQSVDGVSTSENLLDIGPPAAIENGGVVGNLWACPIPPPSINQGQPATVEYYRQLLLGSQAHQLQMMGTTMQQCCQLLWTQQRELQSMRAAIADLQLRSQNQVPQRVNNAENQEEHSNLSRSVHNLGDTLDATLPPSSSLPNLVSLPNSSAALSHTPIISSSNSQQQQQQQLNNQVPPGNRANNYWDNFRSYSRQNLLSGNVKTMTDPPAIANTACSANTTNTSGSSVNSSLIKDKRNREQGSDNLPLPLTGAETQYSLNLQLPSNLQQQDRENTTIRSNIANEVSQQVDNLWEEAHSSFRLPFAMNDDNPFNSLSSEMKEAISSLIAANKRRPDYLIIILREIKAISEDHRLRSHLLRSLRALQDKQTLNNSLNEAPDLTPSESCQSSDEDSDIGATFTLENHTLMLGLVATSHADAASSPASSQVPLIETLEHLEITGTFDSASTSTVPSTSNTKPGYNEDLAEADQSRPESSGNQKLSISEIDNEEGQEEAASYPITAAAATPDLESLAAKTEDERAEDTGLDHFFRLH